MEDEANDPNFPSAFNSKLEIDQNRAIDVLLHDKSVELSPLEIPPSMPE